MSEDPLLRAARLSPAEALRTQARDCAMLGSELYAGLLERAAADFEAGGPVAEVLRGQERERRGSMLALRLMGAVHRRVLEGHHPRLAVVYSDSAASPEETWRAFEDALGRDGEAVRALLARPVQTNEVGRCAPLLIGFAKVAERTGLPLRLLEVGASAGLNLLWDRYLYEGGGLRWGDPDSAVRISFEADATLDAIPPLRVADRRGCDRSPLDATTEEARLTLLSYLWPDQPERAQRLRAALAIAVEHPVRVERAAAADWIEARLAAPAPGSATIVLHSIVMQYLRPEERERFAAAVRAAGERASAAAPVAWLRMEPAGEMAEVKLTCWPGPEEVSLARVGYHGTPLRILAS